MNPSAVILLGTAFGVFSVAIVYVYFKATRRLRESKKSIFKIVTPLVVFGSVALLIRAYGDIISALGGTTRHVVSIGFLFFAAIWFVGCIYVGINFKADSR